MGLGVEVAGKSDVGCVRTNNEDNLGYHTGLGLFVVCDGMGGAAAGEVASKAAVDSILQYFEQAKGLGHYPPFGKPVEDRSERANALASAIHMANEVIHERGKNHPAQSGMGSTVVAALIDGHNLAIGHVGDSRIYLIRNREIQQLTQDHSLVMEQVRRGYMTMEQAEKSDMQNIILRALGSEENVEPEVEDLVVLPGDVLVLATDGLTKLVDAETILKIVTLAPNLDSACDSLIQAAKDGGGDDNITCILAKVVMRPWYKRFLPGGSAKWQNSI